MSVDKLRNPLEMEGAATTEPGSFCVLCDFFTLGEAFASLYETTPTASQVGRRSGPNGSNFISLMSALAVPWGTGICF